VKRYKYKLSASEPFELFLPVTDQTHEYCYVTKGMLVIRKGYAWDGCSPKLSVLGLFWLGTPDGHIDCDTGKPFTYYASLVHDCLLQYDIVPRKEADRIFYDLMPDRYPLRLLYYWAVRVYSRFKTWREALTR
jgi:hypothetical protein